MKNMVINENVLMNLYSEPLWGGDPRGVWQKTRLFPDFDLCTLPLLVVSAWLSNQQLLQDEVKVF